jgi:uncharacterized membrane protein YcgQ (UPF0703/DUF1980 family)
MRLGALLLVSMLLAACSASISEVNARPEKFYQKQISFTGRVTRTQSFSAESLLEIADSRGGRILVRTRGSVEAKVGDWVEVEGILVPETRVNDVVVYDVVVAESVERARAPRLRNLM